MKIFCLLLIRKDFLVRSYLNKLLCLSVRPSLRASACISPSTSHSAWIMNYWGTKLRGRLTDRRTETNKVKCRSSGIFPLVDGIDSKIIRKYRKREGGKREKRRSQVDMNLYLFTSPECNNWFYPLLLLLGLQIVQFNSIPDLSYLNICLIKQRVYIVFKMMTCRSKV